jgi:uncharacterized protein (TIGR00661 family)
MKTLFFVNGLGLGNSTRCHAIIQHLLKSGVTVSVATSGNGLWYFKDVDDLGQVHEMAAINYGSSNGRLSILSTIMSVGTILKTIQENAKLAGKIVEEENPDVIVTDSFYGISAIRKSDIPIVALNNSDVVHVAYKQFGDAPRSTKAQFWLVEEMDYLFHRSKVDLALSPTLDPSIKRANKTFRRIAPVVRMDFEKIPPRHGTVKRVLIMLSGSQFGSSVVLTNKQQAYDVDIVGRQAPQADQIPEYVTYHGKMKNTLDLIENADLMVVNGGFSAISEAFVARKPLIVVPVPNHAEQWVNGRTIEHLGVGIAATEETIEDAIAIAVSRIDDFRNAYKTLPDEISGAEQAANLIMTATQ